MRRSAAVTEVACGADVAGFGGDPGERVEGEHLDRGVAAQPGIVEDRDETFLGAGDLVRRRPSRPAGTRRARPAPHRRRRGATRSPPRAPPALAATCPSARRTRPRCTRASAASRTSPVASAFSTASSRVAAPVGVVTGLALGSSEARQLVRLGLLETQAAARFPPRGRGAARRRRTGAGGGPVRRASRRRGRAATGRRPMRSQCCTWSTASTLRSWSPAEIAARAAKSQFAAWSHGRSRPVVEGIAAIGELHRLTELAVMRHDVGEVVRSSGPAGRRHRSCRPVRWPRRCGRGRGRGDRSTPRSTPRAAGRWPGPGPARRRRRASSAAKIRCAPLLSPRTTQAHPNPLTMPSASSGSCAALQANAASMLARSARAKARYSACRLLRTPCGGRLGRLRRTMRRARRCARSDSPASAIASSANARMLSSSR